MGAEASEPVCLGIDFSGDHNRWRAGRKSNIYIAEVCVEKGRPCLKSLRTVQELSGQGEPFRRLVELLKARTFVACAIDAPFSVPIEYLPPRGHKELLEQISTMERPRNRPFPAAQDFVCQVLRGRTLLAKKPLRACELAWKEMGVNVRSTLWAGPRGGAAMTAACLTLLRETGNSIWPWDQVKGPGLLVEAFPAAQLCHWEMDFEGYNGDRSGAVLKRAKLVTALSKFIEVPDLSLRKKMEQSADALDAVVCVFAAIAVSVGRHLSLPAASEDGQIAIHDRIQNGGRDVEG